MTHTEAARGTDGLPPATKQVQYIVFSSGATVCSSPSAFSSDIWSSALVA